MVVCVMVCICVVVCVLLHAYGVVVCVWIKGSVIQGGFPLWVIGRWVEHYKSPKNTEEY